MKKGKIFWTTIATVIAITTIGISAVGATAGFAITSITASCDGSGLVYFTGTNPGFNLTLMDKHLGPSGPFLSSGISLSIPAGGTSPIAYQLDLSGWTGGPHYRVDSNYNTKSPSLNCGDDDATNTPTPSPTLTLTPTSTPTCEWWQQLLDWQCVDPTPTNTDTPSPTLED
ncbi:MAG TPA: hypothetical protein VFI61_01640, partial [Patescibacteria group bacterium]|nr:hypothetical protein [Patescibacteria group bacterium]